MCDTRCKVFAVLAVLFVVASAPVAFAQEQTGRTRGVNWNVLASSAVDGAVPARAALAMEQSGAGGSGAGGGAVLDRFFAEGGLWTGGGTGFFLGGGALLNLIQGEQHEVRVGAKLARVEETTGFMINGDYFYNFPTNNTYKPYAGAGLVIAHFGCGDVEVPGIIQDGIGDVDVDCDGTDAALEVGGGVRIPRADGRSIFVQLMISFFYGNPIFVSIGYLF